MLRIFVEGQQTGTFTDGVISVTPPYGMQRIYDAVKSYWVKIDFELRGGDVFAVGVEEADPRIRQMT